jgi:hypothetical protein
VGCVEPWVLLVVVVGSRWWCVVKGVVVEWKQVWNMVGGGRWEMVEVWSRW